MDICSIFGTGDGGRLWAVGWDGTILQSDDRGAAWMPRKSGTKSPLRVHLRNQQRWPVMGRRARGHNSGVGRRRRKLECAQQRQPDQSLYSIFVTTGGQQLWAVGDNGTILESGDGGATWSPSNSGTGKNLYSIFGTSDGKRIWAVGSEGTILELDSAKY